MLNPFVDELLICFCERLPLGGLEVYMLTEHCRLAEGLEEPCLHKRLPSFRRRWYWRSGESQGKAVL